MVIFVVTTQKINTMSKDQIFTGQPIFSQLLSFINRSEINRLARTHNSDRYYKKFKTYDHLITMLYAIFQDCTALREVSTGMAAYLMKLNHLGMTYAPPKSTLSDANKRRTYEVFESIYQYIYESVRKSLPDSRLPHKWYKKLYIADSSTITLFKEILKNAGRNPINGKRKGGIKVHTLIKANEDVPCLVRMNAAASHDVKFIQKMQLPKGSIITFDKGYVDYEQYDLWTTEEVIWVTRLRKGAVVEVLESYEVEEDAKKQGILSDQLVVLGHTTHKKVTRTKARLIEFYDGLNKRTFEFITNDTECDYEATTIAKIYKQRWQIEVLFKRLKQNYPIQYFLGDNENAIKIQIWCALIADLLLKTIKVKIDRKWSSSTLKSMIRVHLMSYIKLIKFLEQPDKLWLAPIQNRNKGPTLFES
jgi:hypothetical protein